MAVREKFNAIVVGAGYAGLATAIELARKGLKVKVFESVAKLTNQGKSPGDEPSCDM
jgi:2-polyprenyl-6-methoxyphenol hydroxylase-like FAD-dependent oxidoreductase